MCNCFLTGGIPGPIAFGSVIDISCLLWQDQCGEQGSCYLYQNSAMSRYTLVAGIIYKVIVIHYNLTFRLQSLVCIQNDAGGVQKSLYAQHIHLFMEELANEIHGISYFDTIYGC